jgi:hypothetical protein
MPEFELDDSALPLLLTTFQNTNRAELFTEMERRMRDVFSRVDKIVVVNDIKEMSMPDAAVRKLAAEVDANLREAATRCVLLNIIIVRSKFTRGFMTALRWVNPAASPQAFVASPAEAAKLALKTLGDAGLVTPAIENKLRLYANAA